jgi:hypothetical protein
LERTVTRAGQNARWDRRYFESNSNGEKGASVALTKKQADKVDNIAKEVEIKEIQTFDNRLSATINASVTFVETGQVIWFYEWTNSEELKSYDILETIVFCSEDNCLKKTPSKNNSEFGGNEMRTGTSEAISIQINAGESERARYHELLTDVVKDLVQKFSQGR